MAVKSLACGENPVIHIEAEDHLSLGGWDQSEIQVKIQDESSLQLNQQDSAFYIHAYEDCVVSVPVNAQVLIQKVKGSASISSLTGPITIHNVGGHLTLREVGAVRCDNVGGHLKVYQVGADLAVANVGGNFKGRDVRGLLKVDNVGGSVKLLDVGSVQSMNVGGSIKLKMIHVPNDMRISAGGSIKIWLPAEAGYELDAVSGGQKIVLSSRGETIRYNSGHHRMTVGGGGSLLQLLSGGSISLLDSDWEDDLAVEEFGIEAEVIGAAFDGVVQDRISQRVQERIRRAEERAQSVSRRAEERVRDASRRAEERLREAMQRREERSRSSPRNWDFGPFGPSAPARPAPRASAEERMLVLDMLRDNKITAEEANRLLDALEGKF